MHPFVALPSGPDRPAPTTDPAQSAAIKRWTRDYLQLSEDAVIFVNEFACSDPGCPLLETVIVVIESDRTRTWKLTRPRVAVTKTMVQQTLATPPG